MAFILPLKLQCQARALLAQQVTRFWTGLRTPRMTLFDVTATVAVSLAPGRWRNSRPPSLHPHNGS